MMASTSPPRLTHEQVTALRGLIEQNGYLPYGSKGLRLLAELEQLGGQALAAELRSRYQEVGYLPLSRALELVDHVERLHPR
jgi:hypothetical protein